MREVTCFGKATVANFSCGFDVLGFSVEKPGDTVKLRKTEQFTGVKITVISGTDRLSSDPERNTAGFAVLKYLELFNLDNIGIELELWKDMPLGSGMGSSAASAAAAIRGIDKLFGERATDRQLLEIGMACEKLACGSAHADNIAPSLFGGIILIRETDTEDFVRIPVPKGLYCMIVHPDIVVNTKDSRNILPEKIPLEQAVRQWANIASLISALYQGDFDLLRRSLTDYIVEPVRRKLIPCFTEMRHIALQDDLFNLSISGSGPSVFSLSDSEDKLFHAAEKIKRLLCQNGIRSQYYISELTGKGSEIVDCEV
ncbi:MAG TPA: homoserine kinase [Thermotogota bacterium]|nr:homoserine kinase [Thermotogota bacterium]HPJ89107.1 homoserine kinase [Thermotogota bacterium]HPR96134.1 homoserine kinase [Thermotogota bacterium]